MKEQKKKKWIRTRHKIITFLGRPVMALYCRLRYGIKIEKFREQGNRPYLILLNHQTPFDQFFVAGSFKSPVYYLATEDIFSLGWVSDLIRWVVAPIPIKKQTTDISAVMTCLRVAKEGGTICIAPEGNRTYSGRTVYMNPAIAGMAKKMKLPIALYRIEGGYGVQPRWSDCIRRGSMRGYVSRVIEPEEYAALSNDALMDLIREGLHVDENRVDGTYESKKRAEYLERAVYVCPSCGLSKFESHGHRITCTTCGRTVTYGTDKTLAGEGFAFPFRFVGQWYDYQEDFVNALDLSHYIREPMFRDEAKLSEVIVYQHKDLLRKNARLALYGDRVVVDEGSGDAMELRFEDVMAISVLGRNKLNIYHGKRVYQFKGDKRFNALKYVNIYHRYKNISRGDTDGKFLGL